MLEVSREPPSLPVLIELFKVDANLRRSIAQAFGSMGPDAKPVVPMMLELIRNPDTDQNLRRYLINSVRRIDSAAIKPVGK